MQDLDVKKSTMLALFVFSRTFIRETGIAPSKLFTAQNDPK